MEKALNRRVNRKALRCMALLALGLLILFFPTLRDCFGVPADKLEASSRSSSSAADRPLLVQVVNEDIGYLLFDKDRDYVKFDIYVNRPGFDFGYHFRKSGSQPAEDGLYSLYSYQAGNSTLVYSLTGSGVVRVEQTAEDSAIPGTVYLVDPDRPWAVIFTHMPKSEKHACLTAYNADGEVVPFTNCDIG